MRNMAGRMCHDEGGGNKAGLVVVMGLLLVLAVGAAQFGSARVDVRATRIQDAGSVAAQPKDSLRRSFVATQGGHQPSERPGTHEQQRERAAVFLPGWARQLGAFVFESLPARLSDLMQAFWQWVGETLS
jgi:hypothetical protein